MAVLQDGWTPLHAAAYGGSTEIAMMLLSNGGRPQDHREGVPLEAVLKLDAPHIHLLTGTLSRAAQHKGMPCVTLLATPVLQCMHHACCRLASQQPARWGSSG